MSNRFEAADVRLASRRRNFAGVTISYESGEDVIEGITAAVGQTPWQQVTAAGVTVVSESRDYLVEKADLVIRGVLVEPQAGNLIRQVIDGVEIVFEVMAPGGEPVARTSGSVGGTWRIHTKRVEAPPIQS